MFSKPTNHINDHQCFSNHIIVEVKNFMARFPKQVFTYFPKIQFIQLIQCFQKKSRSILKGLETMCILKIFTNK